MAQLTIHTITNEQIAAAQKLAIQSANTEFALLCAKAIDGDIYACAQVAKTIGTSEALAKAIKEAATVPVPARKVEPRK